MPHWAGTDSPVCRRVEQQTQRCLRAYEVNPTLIREHAAIERATRQGGYGRRQLFELVQNGADAIEPGERGRVAVLLTPEALYCANEGDPIDEDGVEAILSSHLNVKKSNEIGRFGIGFKSVLAVSEAPEFFSRSGSFRFDAGQARVRIRGVMKDANEIPVLRTAEPTDPTDAARRDPNLRDMMEWASTIVRLPRKNGAAAWLTEDIKAFPAEFLLFSPQVSKLELEARPGTRPRELLVEPSRAGLRLIADGRNELWWTASTTYRPSEAVRDDAGVLAERGDLPLVWAVERQAKITRGRFWSFFPTETITTLSGILNAPWKTNEDRQNLLPGPFNDEFIEHAAHLVVDHLGELVERSDPARHLDLLPSRDSYNPADLRLGQLVFDLAKDRPCVPDQAGQPQVPDTLMLHPQGLPTKALAIWSSYEGRPLDWCHPDIETFNRRPRVERLVPEANVATLRTWLEALVQDRNEEASATAIRAAAAVLEETKVRERKEILSSQIVLTDQGELVAPGGVMISMPGRPRSPRNSYVHPKLVDDAQVRRALGELGVRESDALGDLRAFLSRLSVPHPEDWRVLWELAARVGAEEFADAIKASTVARRGVGVMTMAGTFKAIEDALLPGVIVADDRPEDADVTIDIAYHSQTVPHIRRLGGVDGPAIGLGSSEESWFASYSAAAQKAYSKKLDEAQATTRPRMALVSFKELAKGGGSYTGPLQVLSRLGEYSRAYFTMAVLRAGLDPPHWTVAHETVPGKYPMVRFASPVSWRLRREGRVFTSLGVRPPQRAVSPSFVVLAELLPVAQCSAEAAAFLRLAATPEEVHADLWRDALERVESCEDDLVVGALAEALVAAGARPKMIRCRVGSGFVWLPPAEVTVTADPEELSKLWPHGVAVLLASSPNAAADLTAKLALRPASDSVRFEVEGSTIRDPTPLTDEFPALQLYLPDDAQGLMFARCLDLREGVVTPTGTNYESREYLVADSQVWWLDALGDEALLLRLRDDLDLPLTDEDCHNLAIRKANDAKKRVVAELRNEPDISVRLARAIGPDRIRRRLPTTLLDLVETQTGALGPAELGRLAHALYGPDVLREFRVELGEAGLEPPLMWAGTEQARRFASDLGFPTQFAGAEHRRLDPLLEVLGPPTLLPLHDYQKVIGEKVQLLLTGAAETNRGLLSLPTGAGKTRVIVEAIVRVMKDAKPGPHFLWVAETEELCEQAVQSWAYVWRALGGPESMMISRLWSSNEAVPAGSTHQIVVATAAKLTNCIDDPAYEWLTRAAAVIIAHSAESDRPFRGFRSPSVGGRGAPDARAGSLPVGHLLSVVCG